MIDHSLSNDRIRFLSHVCLSQEEVDVRESRLLFVHEILTFSIAVQPSGDRDLGCLDRHGVILESAQGPVPSLAAAVAGEALRGSWWGHEKSEQIFLLTRQMRAAKEVLICRLVNGRITYVHRRLWPALARLSDELPAERISAVKEIHTASGKHEVSEVPFADWAPPEVFEAGNRLSRTEALADAAASAE